MVFKPGQRVRILVPGTGPERRGLGPCPAGMEGVITKGNHLSFGEDMCRVAVEGRPHPRENGWLIAAKHLRPILPPEEQAKQEYNELLISLGAKQSNREDKKREEHYALR